MPHEHYDADIASATNEQLTRTYERIHYGPNGEKLNTSQNPATEAYAEELKVQIEETANQFRAYVDTAPNHNAEYASAIETVSGQLQKDFGDAGKVPIIILGPEEFQEALDVASRAGTTWVPEGPQAIALDGRILMQKSKAVEVLGSNYLIGLGLHEGFHAVKQRGKVVLASYEGDERVHIIDTSGLRGDHGDSLWEEGGAELYRMRRLKDLGVAYDRPTFAEVDLCDQYYARYTSLEKSGPHIEDLEEGAIIFNLPWSASFGAMEKADGYIDIIKSTSGLIAYGLHLIDEQEPGLFADVLASRYDPSARDRFVARIEAACPGEYEYTLYQDYSVDLNAAVLYDIITGLGLADTPIHPM